MDLVYLIGPPAVGKSTTMAALTAECERFPQRNPFRHDLLYACGQLTGAELGGRREAFSGTDALALNVAPVVQQWLPTADLPLLLAEGDRLAHRGFLDAAAAAGYAVTVVQLALPAPQLAARHTGRGASQSEVWRKGRVTKVERLSTYAAEHHRLVLVDAGAAPAAVAATVRATVPALEVLP